MAPGLIPKWPEIDPSTVAPLRDGKPDFFNHQPTRFVSLEEAKARGWKHYWSGEKCPYGHRAARYVSNNGACVDCRRIEDGKIPIYVGGIPEFEASQKVMIKRGRPPGPAKTVPAGPVLPSAGERLFLTKYAEHKDFAKAAQECGRPESEFLAILSYNSVFRDSVNRLEEELGIARTQELSDLFDWDEAKREVFVFEYGNTGNLAQAMKAVGCTNIQFHRELEENSDFRSRLERMEPVARRIYDWKAAELALKGDSRLLGRVSANFFPEKYGENLKMDLNVTQKLTSEQIDGQLAKLLSGLDRAGLLTHQDSDAVEAEFSVVTPERQIEDAGTPETEEEVAGVDANSDLVSDTGS